MQVVMYLSLIPNLQFFKFNVPPRCYVLVVVMVMVVMVMVMHCVDCNRLPSGILVQLS